MPKNNKTKKRSSNCFKTAVENTPDVSDGYQVGLQALGNYSQKVNLSSNGKCEGSLDIDSCTRVLYPQENRWDYAIGYDSKVYFAEVHSAQTNEVSTMLRKLEWLKNWLNNHAPEIKKIRAGHPYFWIMSGKYDILPGSRQARKIAKAGMKPIPILNLPV
ncbi:MAG: hypothetical protein JNJ90_09100 [Saprospiraceae bacterium]|jgi:hypothetical protein|nr:hypothetical protein [Saprospiraceae bacterium]